jgi:TetR/AcrR family transcriptional regulator, transcriptional repressor for nem operon
MASTPELPRLRSPEKTRERILDAAQGLILDHGYGATTVDAVVTRAGITKGAFFHHFGSKSDLARALVERYALLDKQVLEHHLERARKLASDPLQQVLVLIGLYEEEFEALSEPFPGCLFASYIYENKLFDEATLAVLRESTLMWRAVVKELLDRVVAVHPPRVAVDLESLADLFYALTEGSYIMTKTLGDKTLLARHARHLKTYLELLFGK